MKKLSLAMLATGVLHLGLAAGLAARAQESVAVPAGASEQQAQAPAELSPADRYRRVIGRYCLRCHSDVAGRGGLTLESFDVARPEQEPETAEKMIRKLRAGMMPPPPARRPDEATIESLVAYLEERVDEAAAADPNPGRRTFQRLNRAEYARSIRDLLTLEVDVAAFLPPDTVSAGFDNVADVQNLSATVMEGYLRAAGRISRLAVGDPSARPGETTYKVPRTASQLDQVAGAPIGTRGGISVVHNFPANGEYVFKIELHPTPTGQLFGATAEDEQIEVSVDGERVALLDIDPFMSESDPAGMTMETSPIGLAAGAHRVSATFLSRASGPVDDLMAPIAHSLADTQIGLAYGITTLPHLRDLAIRGPYNPTGVSGTPSRRRVFSCRPIAPEEEILCARQIVSELATRAYRRPVTDADVDGLMDFYRSGSREAGFETGIRTALQAILASPHFLLRLEAPPDGVAPGETYRLRDLAIASRLSYFLWATAPDEELLDLAAAGDLAQPVVLEQQVRRMLADPRAEALATRFAAQWLRLQDLEKIHPDALQYPHYDQRLATAMRRETELFFGDLVHQDRSALELLDADYTFVNERLAEHYGIPGVTGSHFRRVQLTDENRRGLLGHGSVLTLTSHANRTSPVLRGKWVMEVLLGSPPPPPPPDVPDLEETEGVVGTAVLSVRERLEQHRRDPACSSCHRVIDPIGLALENFDVTGAWRINDNGVPVDASGELYDGAALLGPVQLREALRKRSGVVLTNFAENLLAYGLGRRVEYHDMPMVRAIVRTAERQGNRMSAFVLAVVNSPAFRMSRAEDAGMTDYENSEAQSAR